MKRYKVSVLLLLALLALSLLWGGCTLKNELLDEQMRIVVSALNDNDAERLNACMMPGMGDGDSLAQGFSSMESIWIPVNTDQVKLVRFQKKTDVAAEIRTVTYGGDYRLPRTDEPRFLHLTYQEIGEKKGLVSVYITWGDEKVGGARDPIQTVMDLICLAAAIVTIVDIVRHKPRKYGWYIVLALFSFRAFTFNSSALSFYVRLPLGAIVYWCLRKRILATAAPKKSGGYPADLETMLFPETPETDETVETPETPEPSGASEGPKTSEPTDETN